MPVISARKISKMYRIYPAPPAHLKEMLPPGRYSYHREFWAWRDIFFDLDRGQTLGLIGPNGSGKRSGGLDLCNLWIDRAESAAALICGMRSYGNHQCWP